MITKGSLVTCALPDTYRLSGIYLTISDSYEVDGLRRSSPVVDILVDGGTKTIAVRCLDVVSQ
jgi:hypothetical protein